MEEVLLFLFLLMIIGLIPAAIAKQKGHDPVYWWVYGSLIFIAALPHSILLEKKGRKCQYCSEIIVKEDAKVCRYCGHELPAPVLENKEIHNKEIQNKVVPFYLKKIHLFGSSQKSEALFTTFIVIAAFSLIFIIFFIVGYFQDLNNTKIRTQDENSRKEAVLSDFDAEENIKETADAQQETKSLYKKIHEDTLYLKNGQITKCTILEKDANGVWADIGGLKTYFRNDEIKEIKKAK